MSLTTGTRLGPYEVLGPLGAGGMGEVYRGMDTRLGREVALKVLPAALAGDASYMARFRREAQVLASLNHSNIATIHGLEENAIVMELVEGVTLAERIAAGPVPLGEALAVARQIVDALEAAHEKGVIHRDLKPANVKITPDGKVKLLDFGLAKAMETSPPPAADLENSPTFTVGASLPGVIMGTAAYMSPEQARGARVDHRADIWAFGVLLHEMVTGRSPFKGATVSDTLAAVLRAELEFDAAPAAVRPLLRRCLEREPRKRLGWISDVREALDNPVAQRAASSAGSRWAIPVAVVALLAAAASVALWLRAPSATAAPVRRFTVSPPDLFLEPDYRTASISPTGKRLAYVAENKLWLRDLDSETPRAIEGSEAVRGEFCWSPDGDWLVFAARGEMLKTPATGAPMSLGRVIAIGLTGCAWSNDGKVIYSTGGLTVNGTPAAGGSSSVLIQGRSGENIRTFLQRLHTLPAAAGRKLLLTSNRLQRIFLTDLETGILTDLGVMGSTPVYSHTGHILFAKPSETTRSDIWAIPFDLRAAKIAGPAFPLIQAAAGASVSRDGTLVYTDAPLTRIVVRDRAGKQTGTLGLPQPNISGFAISPDGRRVAVTAPGDGNLDIWIHDTERDVKTRLTSTATEEWLPRWSPDGKSVAFSSGGDSAYDIYLQPVDGSGEARRMSSVPFSRNLADWSGVGRPILFTSEGKGSISWAIRYLAPAPDGRSFEDKLFVEDGRNPRLSPDGRYMAYVAGGFVFVRPFPEGAGKWQVSSKEGGQPRWSRDGKELFYFESNRLMAVPVSTHGAFSSGAAKPLFTAVSYATVLTSALTRYEVLPDGRFALLEPVNPPGSNPPSIHVVENLPALLRQAQGEKVSRNAGE